MTQLSKIFTAKLHSSSRSCERTAGQQPVTAFTFLSLLLVTINSLSLPVSDVHYGCMHFECGRAAKYPDGHHQHDICIFIVASQAWGWGVGWKGGKGEKGGGASNSQNNQKL